MFDSLFAYHTGPLTPQSKWRVAGGYGYEIGPSPVTAQDALLFVPTAQGYIFAYDRNNGANIWKLKCSDGLVNYVQPIGHSRLVSSTLDGKVYLISYKTGGPQ